MKLAIEASNLSVSFRHKQIKTPALKNVSFSVAEGKTVGFIGPNGAGKTTALHVLLGFIPPDSGTAKLLGEDTGTALSRSKTGYLSEHPECYKYMTANEYLSMTGRLFKTEKSTLNLRIKQLLNELELSAHANKKISTYSRGMLQRVGIAQALINDPEILILDEPTNGLDPIGRLKIRKLIEQLKKQGKTIFFSSHELSEIETVCDEIIMISNGKIIKQGPLAEFTKDGNNLETTFLRALADDRFHLRLKT